MNEQIYGVFTRIEDAELAISALKDHRVEDTEISAIRRGDGVGLPVVTQEANHGLTPTTSADAISGALKGGSVGLTLGVLGGVLALTVPGVGLILAAGPLWGAIGAAVAAMAAGAVSGGVVGYLVDQGIPEQAAVRYHEAIDRGDILISVRSAHISNADARMLLEKYGATEIEEHVIGTSESIAPSTTFVVPPLIDREVDIDSTPAASVITTLASEPIQEMETLPRSDVATSNAFATASTTPVTVSPVSVESPRVEEFVETPV